MTVRLKRRTFRDCHFRPLSRFSQRPAKFGPFFILALSRCGIRVRLTSTALAHGGRLHLLFTEGLALRPRASGRPASTRQGRLARYPGHPRCRGVPGGPEQRNRLEAIKVELDRSYDLLHQRQARAEFGLNPDEAELRPEDVVERYQQ